MLPLKRSFLSVTAVVCWAFVIVMPVMLLMLKIFYRMLLSRCLINYTSLSLKVVLKELKNNQIAIDITDTGKGISKKNLSKVFNPGIS